VKHPVTVHQNLTIGEVIQQAKQRQAESKHQVILHSQQMSFCGLIILFNNGLFISVFLIYILSLCDLIYIVVSATIFGVKES
jgi:hypothetical protein